MDSPKKSIKSAIWDADEMWAAFASMEDTNRKKQIEHEEGPKRNFFDSRHHYRQRVFDGAVPKQCNKHKWVPAPINPIWSTVQNLIIPYIGDMQMQKLKPYHLEDLYATLSKMPCGSIMRQKSRFFRKQKQRFLSGTTIHEVRLL